MMCYSPAVIKPHAAERQTQIEQIRSLGGNI